LFDAAKLAAGQTILVHAGAGGVGSYAVQFAHWKGARVITTASARNADLVRSLGADEAIDYTQTRFEDLLRDLDVVFDTVGEEVQQRSWKVLKKGGVLVSILALSVPKDAAARDLRSAYVFVQPDAAQLGQIAELIDGGHVKPVVETVLPLSDVRQAHILSQSRHACGKIVLRVADYS
jgi:NADPH:quinone reductase-like Zn-dependent oxidoreductase